jgi:hypothetical protein
MHGIGWVLIASGVILTVLGVVILGLGALQLWRQIRAAGAPTGGGAPNLGDLAKLIDSIVKIPQWLLALLAADVQIYLGYWLVMEKRLF